MERWPTLDTAALDLTTETWDFEQTATDTLGTNGTQDDGFDAFLADTETLVNEGVAVASSFDDDLAELDTTAAGFGDVIEQDAVDAHAAAVTNGQPIADTIQALAKDPNVTVWDGDVISALGIQQKFPWGPDTTISSVAILDQIPFLKRSILLNGTRFPLKIEVDAGKLYAGFLGAGSIFLEGGQPVIKRVWHDDFTSIRPGNTWGIYLDIDPVEAGSFTSTIWTTSPDPNDPTRVGMRVTIVVGGAASGGGGGGTGGGGGGTGGGGGGKLPTA